MASGSGEWGMAGGRATAVRTGAKTDESAGRPVSDADTTGRVVVTLGPSLALLLELAMGRVAWEDSGERLLALLELLMELAGLGRRMMKRGGGSWPFLFVVSVMLVVAILGDVASGDRIASMLLVERIVDV